MTRSDSSASGSGAAGPARASGAAERAPHAPSRAGACAPSTRRIALLTGLGAALFLHRPLLGLANSHFSSIDFAQLYSLLQVDPTHVPGNSLLSDPPTQMQPWLALAKAELAAGRLPFWNPYNGNGAPLLANFQSALASPFSLPLYLLPWKLGLVVAAWLKLWAIALFTWLYLARMGLRSAACALGAAGFALCGHNVLLLAYPHSGVTFVLPAALLCIEIALQRMLRGDARLAGPLLGLAAVLVAGLYAGHPETYFFCAGFAALYAAARLALAWRRGLAPPASLLRLGALLCIVAALSAGLCLPQLLPFLEYLEHSRVLEQRSGAQTPLAAALWPLQAFANVLGNPGGGAAYSHAIPPPNYELANMTWVGPALLGCAAAGLALARRRLADAFAFAAVAWWIYAHDLFGVSTLLSEVPLLGLAPLNRSQPLWSFALAVAAACGVDAAARALPSSARRVTAACLAGALLAACAVGAWRMMHEVANSIEHAREVERYVEQQYWLCAVACALVAAAWGALALPRGRRWIPTWGLVAIAFALPAWQWRAYNPLTRDEQHFSRAAPAAELARAVGDATVAVVGEDTLPPCTNIAYGVRLPTNYDALWVRDHDRLYRELCGNDDNWRPTLRIPERALRLFGVQWVLARWDWLPLDSGNARAGWNRPQRALAPLELSAGRAFTQSVRPFRAGLSSVAVWLAAPPTAQQARVRITLFDPAEQRTHAELVVDGAGLLERSAEFEQAYEPRSSIPGRWIALAFPELPALGPRALELRVSGEVGSSGAAILAWTTPSPLSSGAELRGADGALPGSLAHDYAFHTDRLERVARISRFGLYRYAHALPRDYLVERACVVEHAFDALRVLRAPAFDPGTCAVLVRTPPREVPAFAPTQLFPDGAPDADAPPSAARGVELVSEEPCRIELVARSERPALLSTSRAYFPGWRAFVNGVEQPLLESNLAFQAVELGAGESRIVLRYEPTHWRRALALAGASACGLALLALWLRRRARAALTAAPAAAFARPG